MVALLPISVSSQQVVPEDLRCMPVLIEIPLHDGGKVSYGTGVYLAESNKMFLATAAHCIFNISSTNRSELINSTATLSAFTRGNITATKSFLLLDLTELRDHGLIKRHPTHDVTVIQIATNVAKGTDDGLLVFSKGAVALTSVPLVGWQTTDATIHSSDIPSASDIYILGYPVELLADQKQSQVDFNSPLIRKGILSQKNTQTGKLIVDSGVYGGNSGGPVLVIQHPSFSVTSFKIGALITQFVPVFTRINPQEGITNSVLVNSGYGVAEPIEYALELIRQEDITP